MLRNQKVTAIIVAGGEGQRFGSSTPKQYFRYNGHSILYKTLMQFLTSDCIDNVVVAINKNYIEQYKEILTTIEVNKEKILPYAIGGIVRQESVYNALEHLDKIEKPDYVMVHDAARPFVSHQLIREIYNEMLANTAVIPAIPVTDLIKIVENSKVTKSLDRNILYNTQTPQGFEYQLVRDLHRKYAGQNYLDDASLCEASNMGVKTIMGERGNIKINFKEDIMTNREIRVGIGFDAHRFDYEPKDKAIIYLGGVEVPHSHALLAHSDGDVLLHALVDAMLGTIGAGDIGQHFPPTDTKWKNARSEIFVKHALDMVKSAQGDITNVDIVVIGEAPKIGPVREKIKHNLMKLLALGEKNVNIKATTTENMGFTGRKEGIAVQALVTASFPPNMNSLV